MTPQCGFLFEEQLRRESQSFSALPLETGVSPR